MTVRSFFDSNVLVYTDDADATEKRERALDLWETHRRAGHAVISVQVLQEYYRVATAKLGVDPSVAIEKVMLFRRADVVQPGSDDVIAAARLGIEHRLSFWDAMIVHMAMAADCAVLFSEDLQHGQRFAGLEIHNPFRAGS
ncbi:MAG: PIN domain-containing protein [Gammaproteobacteria bacterium]|nr:MAG: PIN domain-containing protein [Gammaproteobacteria bacterium]